MAYQNVWDVPKAMIGETIALNAYIRKEERLKTNCLSIFYEKIKIKKESNPTNVNRRRAIK